MKRLAFFLLIVLECSIAYSQNIGIGIATPVARLHIIDSNVVFTGPATVPASTTFNPSIQGAGTRMMWYPQKAAFRVGSVVGTEWDKDNIGVYSFATGFKNKATGEGSFATGYENSAIGSSAAAMGRLNNASGNASTAMGFFTTASGNSSTAMGTSTHATGNTSTAMGYFSNASGQSSIAGGEYTNASGTVSFAAGNFTVASGTYSTAMGEGTYAKAYESFSAGAYNDITDNPNPDVAQLQDRIFQIGNGVLFGRSNALTVLRNGNVGIGTVAPNAPLSFGNGLGKKITLYGSDAATQYGFGIQGGLFQIFCDAVGADFAFGYGNSESFNEGMRIKGNGNVGIGTPNPTKPLSFPPTIGEKILLYPGGAGEVGIGVYGNELRLHCDNPGSAVSFGTQNNAGAFTEAGRFQISGGHALFVNGNILANGFTINSDERFKENITAIQSPLQKLLQINGVEYEMKTTGFSQKHFMPGKQIGLIAQNVEKVIPEVVSEIDGYKGVDYARLVPLLIEGIKEQQKKIETSNGEIKQLQQQVAELKKLVEPLLKK